MRLSARIFGFLLAFLLLGFTASISLAQAPTTVNQAPQAQQVLPQALNQKSSANLGVYTQKVLLEVTSAIGCQLAGVNPSNPSQPCLGIDPKTGEYSYVENNGGLIGFMGNMIAVLYTPPARTSDYVNYLAGNFGITKGAYAQDAGVGLASIAPISNLWITMRNIAYLVFVIIFLMVGAGIMLRVKIDPRTVMTIQNQIPKIIIGIILVTLSFPIAGFLIDLMWVVILIIINTILSTDAKLFQEVTTSGNHYYVTPFSMAETAGGALGIARDTASFIGGSIINTGLTPAGISGNVQLPTQTDCGFLSLGCVVPNIVGILVGAIFGTIIGILVGIFAFFVVVIAIIWALFRLWFALISAYISILIDIILAPFWIIGGLIPGAGEKIGFGAWLRDLLGNLMAFPAAIAMFLLAGVFVNQFSANPQGFFVPPLLGQANVGANFGSIIAFGIIMITPNVVKMVKAAFKAPQLQLESLGQGIGYGQAGSAAGLGYFMRRMTKPGDFSSAGPLRRFAARAIGGARTPEIANAMTTLGDKQNKTIREKVRLFRYRTGQSIAGPKEASQKSDGSQV